MKNFARLILFFSLNFAALFLAVILFGLLSSWVEFARFIPVEAAAGAEITGLAWKALPPALYLSILLALSYTARRNIPVPLAIIGILVLAGAFSAGLSLAASRTGALEPVFSPVYTLQGGPGLILSRSDNAMILLRGSGDIRGPRVVSIPGQPLIYQEVPLGPGGSILRLLPLPFADESPWFIRSIAIDFSLSARELISRLNQDYFSFGVYAFSLILLLVSLRFLFDLSRWPLANLVLGALVFRGILALETFLNAREVNALINSFLLGRLPPWLITPAIFTALALLLIFYTLLHSAIRIKRNDDD